MEEKKTLKNKMQNILIENRQKLSISGVIDVDSFNDEYILVDTEFGLLLVKGSNLRINKLSIDSSELLVDGNISCCEFTDDEASKRKGEGFWSRLFK